MKKILLMSCLLLCSCDTEKSTEHTGYLLYEPVSKACIVTNNVQRYSDDIVITYKGFNKISLPSSTLISSFDNDLTLDNAEDILNIDSDTSCYDLR